MMLSVFSNLLSKEDDRRVIDNLCAALCRMIASNVEVIPLEQVPRAGLSAGLSAGPEQQAPVVSSVAAMMSFRCFGLR